MKKLVFPIVIFFAIHFSLNAQLMTNSSVSLTIPAGIQLTVQGDVTNTGTTTISNSGTIDLSGDWLNNAATNCFGTSQGTVILNGSFQNIGGTSETIFNNLTLLGSGVKSLTQNITTGGGNAVPAGILNIGTASFNLNSKTLSISNSAGGAITATTGKITSEDTDNSSKVKWTINTATGNHVIPFGNNAGIAIPFTFQLLSGNAGDVTFSTYPTAPNNLPLPTTPVAVTDIFNASGADNSANVVDRFWQVDASGTPVSKLTFAWAPAENASNGNIDPRAQLWNTGTGWIAPVAGQTNPTAQSVATTNVTAYGSYTVSLSASPLPVELLNFTAVATNQGQVLCSWSTASEINNDFFTVEKSATGFNFSPFANVDGAGNSNSVLNYQATDATPYENISYYRLKQTDFNGDFTYSEVVAVKFTDQVLYYILYPNPNQGEFDISCDWKKNTTVTVEIVNGYGALVSKQVFAVQSGQNLWHISMPWLSSGVYAIRLHIADEYGTHKFLVEHY